MRLYEISILRSQSEKMLGLIYLFACLIVFQLDWPLSYALEVSSDDLPNFKKLSECESAALCIKVTYSNGDEDMITADEFHRERHAKHDVFTGRLASTNAKVVVILKDETHEKDLIVFKCKKSHSCHNFRVDLEGSGVAVCSVAPPNPNRPENDMLTDSDMLTEDDRVQERDVKKDLMKMDPLGYKIRVWVYYDDLWKNRFKEEADTRADAVMALVDEMFSEETLQTQLHFDVESVKWVEGAVWRLSLSKTHNISLENSLKPNGPDLNVYLSGTGTGGGVAWVSGICRTGETKLKSSITGWYWDDEYTAEIVAHEIGHNLGMSHDFSDGWGDLNKQTGFRQREDGVDCRGYMDYTDSTDGWSACSVHDFTYLFNKYKSSFCLPQVNLNKECLAECNNESGLCENFCGSENYCCKKGEAENGCDGKAGGDNTHVCVKYMSCDGGDSCCSMGNYKCLEGEGDCDSDSDCASGLYCGTNNCHGPNFDSSDDCCFKAPENCDGGDDCCGSGDYKCLEGEGDCDSDSDCATGLFCGTNNCQGPNFDSGDDCCLKGGLYKECWSYCGYKSGPCDGFCGSGNYCCRQGTNWIDGGCDGKVGGASRHECSQKPAQERFQGK